MFFFRKTTVFFAVCLCLFGFSAFSYESDSSASGNREVLNSLNTVVFWDVFDFFSDLNGFYGESVFIKNAHAENTEIALSVDGRLFKDREDLVGAVRSLPDLYLGEPDYMKAWRLVSMMHYHADPFIAGKKTHAPILAINSVGYGYCDDVSAALANIWKWLGYEARVWDLQGHVVPEVRVGDSWLMFDPDYGIYYFNRDGNIASVAELSKDPSLILNPISPVWDADFSGYSELLATIYDESGGEDKQFYEVPEIEEMPALIDMPAGSWLRFPVRFEKSIASYFGNKVLAAGAMEFVIPSGFHGEVALPFVVVDIDGVGSVEIDGETYEIGSPGLSVYLRGDFLTGISPRDAVTQFKIIDARRDVRVVMALNAMITDGSAGVDVRVFQKSASFRVRVEREEVNRNFLRKIKRRVFRFFGMSAGLDYENISPLSQLFLSVSSGEMASPVRLAYRMGAGYMGN